MAAESSRTISEQRRRFEETRNAARAAAQEEQLEPDVPPDARLWMALTPGLTESLAAACRFPGTDTLPVHELFQRMVSSGTVTEVGSGQIDGDGRTPFYVMTPASRAQVLRPFVVDDVTSVSQYTATQAEKKPRSPILQVLQSRGRGGPSSQGASALLSKSREIGLRVLEARANVAPENVPDEVERWCELAVYAETPVELTHAFQQRVAGPTEAGDVETMRVWIETARPLAALLEYNFSTQLSIAIVDAGRAIERLRRRQIDFRNLVAFHRRDDQVEAVRRLLDGPDDQWGLHFIGAGGVGKTMIVRYITCLLTRLAMSPCTQDPNPFSQDAVVARIDFDYLGLDYPRLHPGLLLQWLADDLRQVGNSRSEAAFESAFELFDKAHAVLQAEGYRLQTRATQHPLVVDGVRRYIDALRSLDKRVLLVLDTCEELAKAGPETGPDSPLEETFRLLVALHNGADALLSPDYRGGDGCANLRVIFSGRRLLASAGGLGSEHWESVGSTLPARDWLHLHRVRGFTEDEARPYLEHQSVPTDLLPAVIQASRPDPGIGIDIVGGEPDSGPSDSLRCNPYQLRFYMAWALEKPPPTFDTLVSAASGQYVALRIVSRIDDATTRQVLPIVAMLGDFDLPTLQAATAFEPAEAEQVFDTLRNQEWTSSHRASSGAQSRLILDVTRGVRDRMVTYFADQDTIETSALERAAAHLKLTTLNEGWEWLDRSDLDAALRVLQHDVVGGAKWWSQLEEKLLAERRADWALELLARLTGPDGGAAAHDAAAGPEVPPENPLRPFVLATQAKLLSLQGPKMVAQAERIWSDIANTLQDRHTPPEAALYRRALAGIIASARYTRKPVEPSVAAAFWSVWQRAESPLRTADEAGAAVAAAEALVEAAEVLAENDPAAARAMLGAGADVNTPATAWLHKGLEHTLTWRSDTSAANVAAVLAFSACLSGRAECLFGQWPEALESLRSSVLSMAPDAPTRVGDWVPPDELQTRLRLEFARAAYPALLSAAETLTEIGPMDAPRPPGSVSLDDDRLRSLVLQLRQAVSQVPLAELLGDWLDAPMLRVPFSTVVAQDDSPNAHRLVAPLSVTMCEFLAAAGLPNDAQANLRAIAGPRDQVGLEVVRHAERAQVGVQRRFRLNDEDLTLDTTLVTSPRFDDRALVWSLTALDGPKQTTSQARIIESDLSTPQSIHTAWRLRHALDGPALAATIAFGGQLLTRHRPSPSDDFWTVCMAIDRLELQLLQKTADPRISFSIPLLMPGVLAWVDAHPHEPLQSLSMLLRLRALLSGVDVPAGIVERVGPHRAAALALEEAELLALRLPHMVGPLLTFAAAQFTASDDPLGACMSRTLSRLVRTYASAASTDDADVSVEDVLQAYAAWQSGLVKTVSLPDSAELQRIAAAPADNELDGLAKLRSHRPWLVRVIACILPMKNPQASGLLTHWLENRYASQVDGQRRLSAEWTGFYAATLPQESTAPLPAPPESISVPTPIARPAHQVPIPAPPVVAAAPPDKAAPPRPEVPPQASNTRRLAIVAGVLVAALVMLTGVFAGANGQVIVALVFLYGLPLLLLWLGYQVLAYFWARLRRLEIRLEPSAEGSSEPWGIDLESTSVSPRQVDLDLRLFTPRLAVAWPPYRLTPDKSINRRARIAGLQDYNSLAAAASRGLIADVSDLIFAFVGKRPLFIQLRPRRELHGLCWEAFVSLAVAKSRGVLATTLPLRFSRLVEAGRVPTALGRDRLFGTSLATTESAAALVRGALRDKETVGGVHWQVTGALLENDEVDALHVIGTVVRGHSGVEMQVRPTRAYASQIVQSVETVRSGEPLSAPLRPAEMRQLFPNLLMCVVQGYPEAQLAARTSTDRYNASLARTFAAEMAAEGIATMVIPPLDGALGAAVLGRVLRVVRDYLVLGVGELHPTVARLQQMIVEAAPDRETGLELAFDLCVYGVQKLASDERASTPAMTIE